MSDHDTACTCDRCRMMVMPTTRTVSERVLDMTAGGFPERTFVGKNTTVADVAARMAELEGKNAKLRACVKAADAYVEAVVRIENSPGMQSVYTVASAHGRPYIGGNWSGELAQYRAARAEVDKP